MSNILVIDDEESIVLMITMALARCGFNVEIATNSSEGIRIFEKGCFDLVITVFACPVLTAIKWPGISAIPESPRYR